MARVLNITECHRSASLVDFADGTKACCNCDGGNDIIRCYRFILCQSPPPRAALLELFDRLNGTACEYLINGELIAHISNCTWPFRLFNLEAS